MAPLSTRTGSFGAQGEPGNAEGRTLPSLYFHRRTSGYFVSDFPRPPWSGDDGLRCGEAGDRNPERAAADVVEPCVVEQVDALRVAAMFAAHTELEMLLHAAAALGTDAHELANAVLVDGLERVALQQTLLEVRGHHAALDVVTAEAERHLGEVVGTETEEVGLFGDLVRAQRGARSFDHRADSDVGLVPHPLQGRVDLGLHPAARQCQLFAGDGERDHHFDDRVQALLAQHGRGGQQGLDLHRIETGLDDAEAHTAGADHRVVLGPVFGGAELLILASRQALAGLLHAQLFDRRQELVERWIEQSNRDRQAVHRLEDLFEVDLLHATEFLERCCLFGGILGQDHLAHDRQTIGGEEHVLRAAQADAFRTEAAGVGGVLAGVGVGAHAHLALADLIGPLQDRGELLRRLAGFQLHLAEDHLAGGAVEGDDVAFLDHDANRR